MPPRILLVLTEVIEDSGQRRVVVDYGIEEGSLRKVCIPPEEPQKLGAKWDVALATYYL